MCSYHGWKFDSQGKCVDIPQVRRAKDDSHRVAVAAAAATCQQQLGNQKCVHRPQVRDHPADVFSLHQPLSQQQQCMPLSMAAAGHSSRTSSNKRTGDQLPAHLGQVTPPTHMLPSLRAPLQALDDKARATACSSSRSCVTSSQYESSTASSGCGRRRQQRRQRQQQRHCPCPRVLSRQLSRAST